MGRAVRLSGNVLLSSDGAGAHEFLTPSDTPTAASAKGRLTPAYARPKFLAPLVLTCRGPH